MTDCLYKEKKRIIRSVLEVETIWDFSRIKAAQHINKRCALQRVLKKSCERKQIIAFVPRNQGED